MMNLDMWYNDNPADVDAVSFTFYPNDGKWRGNLYRAGRIIGDYTCTDSIELEKRFGVDFGR